MVNLIKLFRVTGTLNMGVDFVAHVVAEDSEYVLKELDLVLSVEGSLEVTEVELKSSQVLSMELIY